MLTQWGIEMKEGWGTPNILAGEWIGGGEYGPRYAPQFSPMAERADLILRDLRDKDPSDCNMLVDVASGVSIREMATRLKVSPAQIQLWLEGCWCSFETAIYYRNKRKEWPEKRPRKMLEEEL